MAKAAIITSLLLVAFLMETSYAVEVTLFGPEQYLRTKGKPNVYTDSCPGIPGDGKLTIYNGEENGDNRISSAVIFLNDEEIFGPSDFNQNVSYLEALVNLIEDNSITVELRSKPSGYLTVKVTQKIIIEEGYIKPLDRTNIEVDPETGIQFVSNQVIVIFKEGVSIQTIKNAASSVNGEIVGYIPDVRFYQIEIINEPSLQDLEAAIDQLNQDPNVEIAAKNTMATPEQPDDPEWNDPWNEDNPNGTNWGLESIGALSAWDITVGGVDIKMGIVDGGFYLDHEDINIPLDNASGANNQIMSGDSETDPPCYPHLGKDKNNHGTHVLGIIGAESDNSLGITGIMWEKALHVYRTTYDTANIYHAITVLLHQGARIINLSI